MKLKGILLLFMLFLLFSCGLEKAIELDESSGAIPESAVVPLDDTEDLDALLKHIGERRIVLLGEATHGTADFYTWRASISRKLITEKDFKIIAVEGDWADAYPVNNYITSGDDYSSAEEVLLEFDRWPQWMWSNEEIAQFLEWLRKYNCGKPPEEQVGFFGLDVYGIWESLDNLAVYLNENYPEAAAKAEKALECFAPFERDEFAYARATVNSEENCADELVELLEQMEATAKAKGDEAAFNALQNARVAVHAEIYFRAAVRSNVLSWNVRDRHMTGTIGDLLEKEGLNVGIIVWAHNTHVGDARATAMVDSGLENLGELVRERFGREKVYAIGFGTYSGKVIAASSWGSGRKAMNLPNARKDSWEWILHHLSAEDKIIFLDELQELPFYQHRIGHRAVGVEYDPASDFGNYVPSILPERYDAFIFIDETTALHPLD